MNDTDQDRDPPGRPAIAADPPAPPPALNPAERRALRAKAHHLHPVVAIGHHGLTPAVLHEIGVALAAHGLIKVRVLGDDRDAREALLAEICARAACAPVQHLGKLLILWRPRDEEAPVATGTARAGTSAKPRAGAAGRKRSPAARGGKKSPAPKPGARPASRRGPAPAEPQVPRSKVARRARGQPQSAMDEAGRPPRSPKAPRPATAASKAPRGKARGPRAPAGPVPATSTRASPTVAPSGAGRRTGGGPQGVPRAPNPRRRRT